MPVRSASYTIAALALLAGPAKAEFAGWITGCSAGPVGSDQCPAAAVGAHITSLHTGHLDIFGDLGMESYAMEDALRRVGFAISDKAANGGCDKVGELVIAADIWSSKVKLSSRASAVEKELFDHIERILENGITYAGEGC